MLLDRGISNRLRRLLVFRVGGGHGRCRLGLGKTNAAGN